MFFFYILPFLDVTASGRVRKMEIVSGRTLPPPLREPRPTTDDASPPPDEWGPTDSYCLNNLFQYWQYPKIASN